MTSNEIEYIDLLKMDIEGGEKDVFKTNYESWLSRTRVIIIEIHASIKGCRETF
jgi:FkbM family methyltransferase